MDLHRAHSVIEPSSCVNKKIIDEQQQESRKVNRKSRVTRKTLLGTQAEGKHGKKEVSYLFQCVLEVDYHINDTAR